MVPGDPNLLLTMVSIDTNLQLCRIRPSSPMAQIAIPEHWRTQVCAILQTEATGTLIEWTADASRRFEASFLERWPSEVYTALKTYLSGQHASGCLITMNTPPGETYEFFFQFDGQKTYGKILLRTDAKRIVLFSAHLPLGANLSCE